MTRSMVCVLLAACVSAEPETYEGTSRVLLLELPFYEAPLSLALPCWERPLLDVDEAPGLQPECAGEIALDAGGVFAMHPCTETSTATCYRIVDEPQCWLGPNLAVRVEHTRGLAGAAIARLACLAADPSSENP